MKDKYLDTEGRTRGRLERAQTARRHNRDRHRRQRGFGRSVAAALKAAGAHVVGVARSAARSPNWARNWVTALLRLLADAADPATAHRLIDEHRPTTVVLCAGAAPTMSALQDQTWETFSQNWNVDVAQAFHWTRAALALPLAPGSSVIAVVQRRRAERFTAQRRLCGSQGDGQVHHELRRGRIGAQRPRHRIRIRATAIDAGHRPRTGGGEGLRRAAGC